MTTGGAGTGGAFDSLGTVTARTFWNSATGGAADLDLAALLLGENGRVAADTDFVFFNNRQSTNGAVRHVGGDDGVVEETVVARLDAVPGTVRSIVFVASVYDEVGRFGDLADARIVIEDEEVGVIADFALIRRGQAQALVYAALERDRDRWVLRALAEAEPGLAAVAARYGVNV